jgi:hypothetical protein
MAKCGACLPDGVASRDTDQPKGRASAFGVAALTVFNRDGEFVAMVGKRSSKVGTYPDTFHVIPAGMTNIDPKDADNLAALAPGDILDVRLLIEKEFLEEVFSRDRAATCCTSLDLWTATVRKAAREHLYGPNGEYEADIHLTGVVFDLLNYRPEICALILIRSAEWWKDHKSPLSGATAEATRCTVKENYEWSKLAPWNVETPRDRRGYVTPLKRLSSTPMPVNSSVMSGVAAFHLGLQKACELLASQPTKEEVVK